MNTEEIIALLREEGEGNRGVFYEAYGSNIRPLLIPLADLLDNAQGEHPEAVSEVIRAFNRIV